MKTKAYKAQHRGCTDVQGSTNGVWVRGNRSRLAQEAYNKGLSIFKSITKPIS